MVDPNLLFRILLQSACILACFMSWGDSFVQSQIIQVSGRRVYRKGQKLVLNCTTTTQNYKNDNLIWTKDGKTLPSQKINNDTLQLLIPNVKTEDSGGYRCAVQQQTRVVRSVLVHVTVGVAPSRPINVSWRSVSFRICITWSASSNITDDPVTYEVHYRCVSSCDFEDPKPDDEIDSFNRRWHVGCKNTPLSLKREQQCCLSYGVSPFINHEGVVVATNRFGMSKSKPFNFSRDLTKTTPGPPQSLTLHAKGYGEIVLEWTPQQSMYWTGKYIIYYSTQGDQTNKTIKTDETYGQYYYRLTDLKPFTKYTVYLAAIDPESNTVGIPVGPVSIVTREEEPSDAPEIVKWHSRLYPDNKKLRMVTVYWKLPHKETWNGNLTKYIIKYRSIREYTEQIDAHSLNSWGETMEINNSSAIKGTIKNLRVDTAYEVEMQMCNRAGCGGIGNRVVISTYQKTKYETLTHIFEDSLVIGCISVVSIVLIVASVLVFIRFRKNKNSKPKTSYKIELESSSVKEVKEENV